MITAYYSNSTSPTSDYSYDGTASWDCERWYEDEDNLFYIPTITITVNDFDAFKRAAVELKRLENIEQLKQLAKLSRAPMLPHTFYLAFVRPFFCRKMCRCNRHGIGLRIRMSR